MATESPASTGQTRVRLSSLRYSSLDALSYTAMTLHNWKPIHELLFNFGADCAVLDSQVEQMFAELDQMYVQLTAFADELSERERRLAARERAASAA